MEIYQRVSDCSTSRLETSRLDYESARPWRRPPGFWKLKASVLEGGKPLSIFDFPTGCEGWCWSHSKWNARVNLKKKASKKCKASAVSNDQSFSSWMEEVLHHLQKTCHKHHTDGLRKHPEDSASYKYFVISFYTFHFIILITPTIIIPSLYPFLKTST